MKSNSKTKSKSKNESKNKNREESSSLDLGLELTCNSKVGWAFSMPIEKTCIGRTGVCSRLCYGRGIRYRSSGQTEKRERNFRTVELLLKLGGPELLAENLIHLIDLARPIDYLSAKYAGQKTVVPWSLRLNDVGDVHSDEYVQAWKLAVEARPNCSVWLYTRSFELSASLLELVTLPNCQGFLSVDSENYKEALVVFATAPNVWKLALLQEKEEDMSVEAIEAVKSALSNYVSSKSLLPDRGSSSSSETRGIVFPYHHGGRHVKPIECLSDGLVVCPQILGAYELQSNAHLPKPCQLCRLCLPAIVPF